MLPVRAGLLAGLAVAAVGCSQPNSGSVTGTIRYKGQPVKAGIVYLHSDRGQYQSPIKEDGSYRFPDLPNMTATVVIDTEGFNPDQKPVGYAGQQQKRQASGQSNEYKEYNAVSGGGAHANTGGEEKSGLSAKQKEDLAKVYVKVPKKYTKENTSDLKVTVDGSAQVKDFDLTD